MGSDDFKILKFKVAQMFLRVKVMGRGRWEGRSWHLCREGMSITMSLSWDLAVDITQEKGAKGGYGAGQGSSYDCNSMCL